VSLSLHCGSIARAGLEREALLHRIDDAWAAVVDLDELVALGISGRGAEPGDYDLVAIEDLSAYPSRY
jgi:hypothetical protein